MAEIILKTLEQVKCKGGFTEIAELLLEGCVINEMLFAAMTAAVLETARQRGLAYPDLCKMMIASIREDPTNPVHKEALKYYNTMVVKEEARKKATDN